MSSSRERLDRENSPIERRAITGFGIWVSHVHFEFVVAMVAREADGLELFEGDSLVFANEGGASQDYSHFWIAA